MLCEHGQRYAPTIAQLLEKTDDQLRSLRNFGRTCSEEIDARLVALREENRPTTRIFTPEVHRLMAGGDFSFLVGEELLESDNEFVAQCIEAQEALGDELALACLDEPEKIIPILGMVREFGQRITWQQELQTVLEEVPSHRRSNQAVASNSLNPSRISGGSDSWDSAYAWYN